MTKVSPFNKEKHDRIMFNILIDFARDITLSNILGFKGGTASYFFYGLDRASVDLDFDLLKEIDTALISKQITSILSKYGTVKTSQLKRNTLFFLLSYGATEHSIKIEISTRWPRGEYILLRKNGLPFLVMKESDVFANKLFALINRETFANRDLYDLRFFFRKNTEPNKILFEKLSGISFAEWCKAAIKRIEALPKSHPILDGIGFLLENEKQKAEVKTHLVEDTLFFLRGMV